MALTDDELEALLEGLEADLTGEVLDALNGVADEFARAVDGATRLVAAAFSVSRVGEMWKRRVPGIMARLRRIAGRGAQAAAEDVGESAPSAADLDTALQPYMDATTQLLNAVGDRLAAEATQSLAEGVNAGETLDQLKARMTAVFADDGAQLGPTRAERIAMTEATRAFNAGELAAAQALTGPDRPLVKQWLTRRDKRVREAHADVNGQLQFLDDPFTVGGIPMQYPGDPTAPPDLTINCRCLLRVSAAPAGRTASMAGQEDLAAAAAEHTGAMIALMPSEADAQRLAIEGGEAVDQLHLTLLFLGDAADWSTAQKDDLRRQMSYAAAVLPPVHARVFGAAQWNPASDEPAWVWNVGDDSDTDGPRLANALFMAAQAVYEDYDYPAIPTQHSPWAPHICAQYSTDNLSEVLAAKTGPVVFDRLRVAFGGEYTDFPLIPDSVWEDDFSAAQTAPEEFPTVLSWSTPDGTALAFENQQTGDGRVFSPGALYWDGSGPWPLQYAEEMRGGHDGAELAGAIMDMAKDGNRLIGSGLLYLTQGAGYEAAHLLSQGAPLGVSVDLDDVDIEMVDTTPGAMAEYNLRMATASLMPTADGGYHLTGETQSRMTAADGALVVETPLVTFMVGPDGRVPAGAFELEAATGELEAAAGDGDVADGVVVDAQRSGDYLLRITRARVRGATLVSIPAYADARIVLDSPLLVASSGEASTEEATDATAAATQQTDYDRVLRHVRRSKAPVGAARVAQFLSIPIAAVHRHLSRASQRGEVVKLTRGLYTDRTSSARADHLMDDDRLGDELAASATGAVNLPVAPRDRAWDGPGAETRVFEWADGDCSKLDQAFAWRDDSLPCDQHNSRKLGYTDVIDGTLTIIPRGVFAVQSVLGGGRGGVDIPADEMGDVVDRMTAVRAHVDEETGGEGMAEMEASAWTALRDLPAMPASWFREPTVEELPPGGPGVNYINGRIFGWVAQAGEAHAGFAKKVTIEGLGRIDTTHFLRQRFTLDDGSTVKAGAFTMNAGHHRDGAECETAACQFDDTRTVAGIVTVGMSDRGMWFSGAAAPWLSEWDRSVFMSTQPSYHMKRGGNGAWQLRAVLAVPVPGHSSPLLASAVIERSQMALTAAATMADVEEAVSNEKARQAATDGFLTPIVAEAIDYDRLADAMVASMARAEQRKADDAAALSAMFAEVDKMVTDSDATTEEG